MIIGIIGAFDEEIDKFIEMFQLTKVDSTIWDSYSGNLEEKQLVEYCIAHPELTASSALPGTGSGTPPSRTTSGCPSALRGTGPIWTGTTNGASRTMNKQKEEPRSSSF